MTDASGAAALVARLEPLHHPKRTGAFHARCLRASSDRHSRPLRQGRFVNCGPRQWEHRLQREGKNEPAITSIVMLPSLVIEKPCAAVADLSPAKRAAVIECFNNRGLHKCNGYWCGPPEGKHISGVTVADLARDGVLTVIKNLRHGSAQLTERGQWFARTLIAVAN
jgi:hypothetical protein